MSNNSMVVETAGGHSEISRGQWVQALAAHTTAEAAMNPVLLKPGGDRDSHVVVMGEDSGPIASSQFVNGRQHLGEAAHAAYDDLASRFDVVVCEGAGSPAEINLRESDYVNMGLARHGDIPTLVVGDIDRGGVFAALYGTLALLDRADQELVAGFIVNKFRGDRALLEPAVAKLQELTSRPVYGVLPWQSHVWMDAEDTLTLPQRRTSEPESLRVRVVRLPRISNFTDADALELEPGVDVQFVAHPRQCADADLIVLPGTRSTLADLEWLYRSGMDEVIVAHARAGKPVLGFGGGYHMLGTTIEDPDGIDNAGVESKQGLGLLDIRTRFTTEKTLRLVQGDAWGQRVHGYEIHYEHVDRGNVTEFLGGSQSGSVFGTMWHGSLESDEFRQVFLKHVASMTGASFCSGDVQFEHARHARLDLLGDLVEHYLDLDALMRLGRDGVPPYCFLPAGGSS